jgi:hypothetical protein
LDAVEIYCCALEALARSLFDVELKSRGFLACREYLTGYTQSAVFISLMEETKKVKASLSTVRYCVLINGDRVTVRKYDAELDYSAEVEKTFAKFKQGAVKDYRVKFSTEPEMNHIEARVLESVTQLYPEIFAQLASYCAARKNYFDEAIGMFDREVQFYVAYLEYTTRFRKARLTFCYPQISDRDKEVFDQEAFDLALAQKLINE